MDNLCTADKFHAPNCSSYTNSTFGTSTADKSSAPNVSVVQRSIIHPTIQYEHVLLMCNCQIKGGSYLSVAFNFRAIPPGAIYKEQH